jgi:hypothetical protein
MTYETFGRPRSITQGYEEDQDKLFLRKLEKLMPDEILLVDGAMWHDLNYNTEIDKQYYREIKYDPATQFGHMTLINIRGWTLHVYTMPGAEGMKTREMTNDLKLELMVAAL